jgi:hypothetical protein
MPKDVACPNPGCSHVFPAAAIIGVAALVCPKCGGVFQVKPKQVATTQSDAADGKPRRDIPPTFDSRKRATIAWLAGGAIVFLTLALATAAVYRQREPAAATGPEPFRSTEHNYSLRLPNAPWQKDDDLAKRLHGVLAFRRSEPDAQVVLVVRDYPSYVPTAAELRDDAIARLRDFPVANLQREDKSKDATFAGKPAGRIVFQGDIDGTIVSGDVYYATHQGAAYWLYRWCPTEAVAKVEASLADMADRFALLDLRADWHPPRPSFTGTKLAYKLTAEGDRWEKASYPQDNYDPMADLALIGRPPGNANDPARAAQLLVLLLPAGDGDPIERAKAHLLQRQKEVYDETTIAEAPSADEKAPTDKVGDIAGKVLTLRVTNRKDRERLVVLGIVPRKDGPLVIWAECDFARRAIWEADFRKLVTSYQSPK